MQCKKNPGPGRNDSTVRLAVCGLCGAASAASAHEPCRSGRVRHVQFYPAFSG